MMRKQIAGAAKPAKKERLPEIISERMINYERVVTDGKEFKIPLRGASRNWNRVGDADLVSYAKAFCNENLVNGSIELKRKYSGLYQVLCNRNLQNQIFEYEKTRDAVLGSKTFALPMRQDGTRDWSSMSDAGLVEYAVAYCREHRISAVADLQNKDPGLYTVMCNRKIQGDVFGRAISETLGGKTFVVHLYADKSRCWERIDNRQLIEYAKAYCAENKIAHVDDLKSHNSGLHGVLRRRKLLDAVFQSTNQETLDAKPFTATKYLSGWRNWKKMDDDELVSYAKAFCKENSITGPGQLQSGNPALFSALLRRNCYNKVFSEIKSEESSHL